MNPNYDMNPNNIQSTNSPTNSPYNNYPNNGVPMNSMSMGNVPNTGYNTVNNNIPNNVVLMNSMSMVNVSNTGVSGNNVPLTSTSNNKNHTFGQFAFIIGVVVIILVFFFSMGASFLFGVKNGGALSSGQPSEFSRMIEVLPHDSRVPTSLPYLEPNFYFVYKDIFYYYDVSKNELLSMNLDMTDKKVVSTDGDLAFASFFLVYNDEAYFYSPEGYIYNQEPRYNRKVNLKTGEVTDLDDNYNYLPITFKDGVVTALGDRNSNDSHTFRKYNLNTGKFDFQNTYQYNHQFEYIYDYATGSIYAIKYELSGTTVRYDVFKNNNAYASFTVQDIFTKQKYGFRTRYLYVDDNSLFFTDTTSLYRYDFQTKTIQKSNGVDLSSFVLLNVNDSSKAYLYNRNDCYVYELDKKNVVLNKSFKVPGEMKDTGDLSYSSRIQENNSIIYDAGEIVFFPVRANNLKYLTRNDDSLGIVVIYDKVSKDSRVIENVRRAFFDYENSVLYIFAKKNNNYEIIRVSWD